MRDPRIVMMMLAGLGISFGVYANVFFLPLIIKDLGFSNLVVSYLAALPAALGAVGMVLISRSSDRTGERVMHVAVPTFVAGVGLLMTGAFIGNAWVEMISLCIVGVGLSSCLPVFWTLPTAYLGAGTAAAGIALINSFSNMAGYLAPQMVGLLRDYTGNYSLAMLLMGGIVLFAAALLPFCGVGVAASRLLWRTPAT
jgi:MFS family permease